MLVLTRKQQERIHIGENVTITVVRIKGNTVRVGIEAPRDVRVMRGEAIEADKSRQCRIVPTAAGDENGSGQRQGETGGEEPLDKPAAPWQHSPAERRSPRVPFRNDDSVPANAV